MTQPCSEDGRATLRALYEAYQRRDWDAAALLLHPDAEVVMPASGERLIGREHVMRYQREYPEPWGTLTVLRVVGDDNEAAAEVEVAEPTRKFAMSAFWRMQDGLLKDGIEYWVIVGGESVPPTGPTAESPAP